MRDKIEGLRMPRKTWSAVIFWGLFGWASASKFLQVCGNAVITIRPIKLPIPIKIVPNVSSILDFFRRQDIPSPERHSFLTNLSCLMNWQVCDSIPHSFFCEHSINSSRSTVSSGGWIETDLTKIDSKERTSYERYQQNWALPIKSTARHIIIPLKPLHKYSCGRIARKGRTTSSLEWCWLA